MKIIFLSFEPIPALYKLYDVYENVSIIKKESEYDSNVYELNDYSIEMFVTSKLQKKKKYLILI